MKNRLYQMIARTLFKDAERLIHYITRILARTHTPPAAGYDMICHNAWRAVNHLLEGYMLFYNITLPETRFNLSILLTTAAKNDRSLFNLANACRALRAYTADADYARLAIQCADFMNAVNALHDIACFPPIYALRKKFARMGNYLLNKPVYYP